MLAEKKLVNKNKKLDAHLAPAMAKDHPNLPIVSASGCFYKDATGRKFLDFTAGIAVMNAGHCHPHIVNAIQKSAAELIHGPIGVVSYDSILTLADRLSALLPGDLGCFFFGNSGTEAVEGALKLARHVKKKTHIISFLGGFHGRTLGALQVTTSKSKYRKYQPASGSSYQVPYYDPQHSKDEAAAITKLRSDFLNLFDRQVSADEVAAVIVEPVLGEGGYIVPPKSWLQELRRICDEYDLLLIFDEIQTGFGRTGEWFAAQTFETTPDIMVIAKAIASGLPLSATVASHELMSQWPMGAHSTTFGGNPIACSAALATLDVLENENLIENARIQGAYLIERLRVLAQKYPFVGDVRGVGMMIGVDIIDPQTGQGDGEAVMSLLDMMLQKNLLVYLCGIAGQVIRIIPPLIISRDEIDQGLEIIASVFEMHQKARLKR